MREVLDDVRRMLASGRPGRVRHRRRHPPLRATPARLAAGRLSSSGEMVGSVSGGCVESDVALRAEEVLAGGPPLLLRYGISDDDAFDVGLPCGGEIEVFVQPADAEELDRVEAALASPASRLSVTTTLTGDGAGAKAYGDGEAPLARRCAPTRAPSSSTTPRAPVMMVFGAVDTAQALCRMAKQVGFHTIVSDARAKFATPRAAAGRRRDRRRLAGDGLRPARRRRRDLRRRPDPRRPLRRAGARPGAALRRAVHRRARQPAGAGRRAAGGC